MSNKFERVLLFGAGLWYLGEGLLGPLFAVFTERVGGDIFDITWAWASYLIVSGLLYVVVGRLADKMHNPAKLMVAGYFLNAIFTFSYLFVTAPHHLFIVQIGLGVAAALAAPTWDALYGEHAGHKSVGYAWGLADGQAQVIYGIAVIIGGFIVSAYSFATLFVIMGIIQVVSAIMQARILGLIKTRP